MNEHKEESSIKNNIAKDTKFVVTNVAGSTVRILTSTIPIVGNVISELSNIVDKYYLEKRLNEMQGEINNLNYTMEQIQAKVNNFDEHRYFFTRNNLKYYFSNCIPESSRELCQSIIKSIMGEEEEYQEQVCEIIRQLNAQDINLIGLINKYLVNGPREEYSIKKEKHEKEIEKTYKDLIDFVDNNVIFDERTIFYSDFIKYMGLPGLDPENLLHATMKRNGKQVFDLTYLMQSLLKLQSLGLITIDFKLTLGNSSANNIDRFHISVFGKCIFDLFNKAQ